MPEDKIGVIGICSLGGPIGPNGNHLRWSFPGDLGFWFNRFALVIIANDDPVSKIAV